MTHTHTILGEPDRFELLCGVSSLGETFTQRLEDAGLRFDREASVKLIIDVPNGFGLHTLEMSSRPKARRDLRLVVATLSFCVEYWEDLWDLHPDILIVDSSYEHAFAQAIRRASRGERYRLSPPGVTPLNRTERRILSLIAIGLPIKEITERLAIQS